MTVNIKSHPLCMPEFGQLNQLSQRREIYKKKNNKTKRSVKTWAHIFITNRPYHWLSFIFFLFLLFLTLDKWQIAQQYLWHTVARIFPAKRSRREKKFRQKINIKSSNDEKYGCYCRSTCSSSTTLGSLSLSFIYLFFIYSLSGRRNAGVWCIFHR